MVVHITSRHRRILAFLAGRAKWTPAWYIGRHMRLKTRVVRQILDALMPCVERQENWLLTGYDYRFVSFPETKEKGKVIRGND